MSYVIEANVMPMVFPTVAVIGALVSTTVRRPANAAERLETWLRWWFGAAVGFGALWIAVAFFFATDTFAAVIGYQTSGFQWEVATANLGFAVVGFFLVRTSERPRSRGQHGRLF
ncbi:DUF6790 family protein [Fodinicola feengrottensis]|uniref:DUF6790 family protein n=1 Tax=Fodinicola feengrottensis TaxID=435914 RepID=UPI0013D8109B|nr:DUF6790 family protein [Fodinicola feengrottensis]